MQKIIWQYPALIHDKNPSTRWIKETFLIIVKAIYHYPTASIILNRKKLRAFFPTIWHKTSFLRLASSIPYSIGVVCHINYALKIYQGHPNKEKTQALIFANDEILYLENPRNFTHKDSRTNRSL